MEIRLTDRLRLWSVEMIKSSEMTQGLIDQLGLQASPTQIECWKDTVNGSRTLSELLTEASVEIERLQVIEEISRRGAESLGVTPPLPSRADWWICCSGCGGHGPEEIHDCYGDPIGERRS